MKIFRLCLLLTLSFPLFSFSQSYSNIDFAAQISEKSIKKNVKSLCSDIMQGRETGTEGQKNAAVYIYSQFKQAGLQAVDKSQDSLSYFQSVKLSKLGLPSATIKVNKKTFYNYKDFVAGSIQDSIFKDLDIVYIGNSPIQNYSEIDFTNKAVLFLTSNFHKAFSQAYDIWKHSKPSLILFCDPINTSLFDRYIHTSKSVRYKRFRLKKPIDTVDSRIFGKESDFYNYLRTHEIIPISVRLTKAITGLKLKQLKNSLANQNQTTPIIAHLQLQLKNNDEIIKTENVISLIEGTEKPEEFIIISAHFDHLGVDKKLICYGANDNASGTAALIEIAKAFKYAELKGQRPKRSVIFTAFTAEEKGLLGSEFFVRNSPVPLKSIKANLNMDMLGRIDEYHSSANYIYLLGTSHLNPQLKPISDSLNGLYSHLILDYKYDQPHNPFYGSSDQASFVKNKIPSIMYFNGLHDDYHTPEDTPNKLDYKNIERVAQLVFLTAWELSNQD
ncbi:M28 family metallopeptidase [Ancylomarina sp. 16SWW S1-10-2]|uniref:M28 family metallopeptidase n=1 Tax=Ancylomarina sp. 16SWW S1-10-2 TaxID=2499681 RepID=UPI0012AE29A8|nr:M28 family peptidase [Ancylomarina sp. 16SWW S1-10-2]MRT92778.1 M28 family peptidase [Ancylomarina sp. 16SWW S1-10-2]